MTQMIFTALDEDLPGPKWQSRWRYSWPAYRAWLATRHFKESSPAACLEALQKHMPQLVETYKKLLALSGGGALEACFLSHWQPPEYLSGCSIAAKASHGMVRLVRNYDLSPELNEGLLLKSRWQKPVMGMVEFLWGLSDGLNAGGLCAAIAYGGRSGTGVGFGSHAHHSICSGGMFDSGRGLGCACESSVPHGLQCHARGSSWKHGKRRIAAGRRAAPCMAGYRDKSPERTGTGLAPPLY